MTAAIDRHEVERLLRDEHAQLVEVLPPDEYEDEHLVSNRASTNR